MQDEVIFFYVPDEIVAQGEDAVQEYFEKYVEGKESAQG